MGDDVWEASRGVLVGVRGEVRAGGRYLGENPVRGRGSSFDGVVEAPGGCDAEGEGDSLRSHFGRMLCLSSCRVSRVVTQPRRRVGRRIRATDGEKAEEGPRFDEEAISKLRKAEEEAERLKRELDALRANRVTSHGSHSNSHS